MKTVIPTTVVMLALMLMVCVSVSLIAFDLQVAAARNFHAEAINRLQASYYATSVVGELQEQAAANNYDLEIGDGSDIGDTDKGGRIAKKVTLNYEATMPLFFTEPMKGEIVGIAR